MKRRLRVFVFSGILMALLCLSSATILIKADLPTPPPTTVTKTGPLDVQGKQAFTGGVLLVPADPPASPHITYQETDAVVAVIYGEGSSTVQPKSWKILSKVGESIFGSITSEQAQGLGEAISAVRPPKSVALPEEPKVLTGDAGYVTTWTLTKIGYQHKHFELYKISKTDPAQEEELIGYINVETPSVLVIEPSYVTLPPTETPTPTVVSYANPDALGNFTVADSWVPQLPDNGLKPLVDYGTVYVYDDIDDDLAAETTVRPGETVGVLLPPGAYSVEADVAVFGIHFTIDGGTVESDRNPLLLEISMIVGNLVWGILILIGALAAVIVAAIVWGLHRRLRAPKSGMSTCDPPLIDVEDAKPPDPKDSVLNDLGKISIADFNKTAENPTEQPKTTEKPPEPPKPKSANSK
jgi:hypothetical protein